MRSAARRECTICPKMRTHRIFASVTGGLASALVTVGVTSKIALTMVVRQKAIFFMAPVYIDSWR
jgi:hypothetical protein